MSNTEKEIQEENINTNVDATNEEIINEETATAEQENIELSAEEKLQKELDEANESSEAVILCKTPKLAAKTSLKDLNADLMLLVSGKADLIDKIRYEILSIMGF